MIEIVGQGPLVYLAGPMTDLDDHGSSWREEAVQQLTEEAYWERECSCIVPHWIDELSWDNVQEECEEAIEYKKNHPGEFSEPDERPEGWVSPRRLRDQYDRRCRYMSRNDLKLIEISDALVYRHFEGVRSMGSMTEIDHALKHDIPLVIITENQQDDGIRELAWLNGRLRHRIEEARSRETTMERLARTVEMVIP